MQRREQIETDIPQECEQQHDGALPPEKRHGLPPRSPVLSDPISHAFNLVVRLSQFDAKGIAGCPKVQDLRANLATFRRKIPVFEGAPFHSG
jgi:hypothetical protein